MGWEGEEKGKCGKRACDIFTYNKSHFKVCTALTIFASLFECTLSLASALVVSVVRAACLNQLIRI